MKLKDDIDPLLVALIVILILWLLLAPWGYYHNTEILDIIGGVTCSVF